MRRTIPWQGTKGFVQSPGSTLRYYCQLLRKASSSSLFKISFTAFESRAFRELSPQSISVLGMGGVSPHGISGQDAASEGNLCLAFLEGPSSCQHVHFLGAHSLVLELQTPHRGRGTGTCTKDTRVSHSALRRELAGWGLAPGEPHPHVRGWLMPLGSKGQVSALRWLYLATFSRESRHSSL